MKESHEQELLRSDFAVGEDLDPGCFPETAAHVAAS
jgi:hypothetical protein